MNFPESLFLLSQRDQQVTWLDTLVVALNSGALLQATITQTYTVPEGRVLLLHNALVQGAPGAGQNVAEQRMQVITPSGVLVHFKASSSAFAAGINGWMDWQGQLIVPANCQVQGEERFNAGAVANNVAFMLFGMLVPIANVQRV